MGVYINLIISTIITVLIGYQIRKFLKRKNPLQVSYLTAATGKINILNDQNQLIPIHINTHTLIISNPYDHLVNDIRVANTLPNTLKAAGHTSISEVVMIHPSIGYEVKKVENGNGVEEIIFSKLRPRESVFITYMYPLNTYVNNFNAEVNSDEGRAQLVAYVPEKRLPAWLKILLWCLVAIGAVVTINFLLKIISLLSYLLRVTS